MVVKEIEFVEFFLDDLLHCLRHHQLCHALTKLLRYSILVVFLREGREGREGRGEGRERGRAGRRDGRKEGWGDGGRGGERERGREGMVRDRGETKLTCKPSSLLIIFSCSCSKYCLCILFTFSSTYTQHNVNRSYTHAELHQQFSWFECPSIVHIRYRRLPVAHELGSLVPKLFFPPPPRRPGYVANE